MGCAVVPASAVGSRGGTGRMKPLRVMIGYDSREPIAYHVASHSILSRASVPVSITPIALQNLRGIYTRDRGPTESTEFSLTRFLTPYLSEYEGWSLFCDSDFLFQDDIAKLWLLRDDTKSLMVVPHHYIPTTKVKMDGAPQADYPRKNQSSLMLMNNAGCKALTPAYVNQASGLELHRFLWLPEHEIGFLPATWNHLVGEFEPDPTAKGLHYTLGGPWFPNHENCDHADLWLAEKKAAGF